MASAVGRVENLVIEDGEVQCKTKTDRVSGSELGLGNVRSVLLFVSAAASEFSSILALSSTYLVGFMSSGGSNLALLTRGKLSKVPVIVTLPVEQKSAHLRRKEPPSIKAPRSIDDSQHTFCGRKPWTRQIRLWGSETRRGRRGHLGRPAQARSRSSGDTRGWSRRACLSLWIPPFAQWTR